MRCTKKLNIVSILETVKKSNTLDNEIKKTLNGKINENTIEIADILNKYF